jgi:hypothetical protein
VGWGVLRADGSREPDEGVRAGGSGGLLRECCRVGLQLRDGVCGDCISADTRRPDEAASLASAALLLPLLLATPCCLISVVVLSDSRLPGLPLVYCACQYGTRQSIQLFSRPEALFQSHCPHSLLCWTQLFKQTYANPGHDGLHLNSMSLALPHNCSRLFSGLKHLVPNLNLPCSFALRIICAYHRSPRLSWQVKLS